MFYYIALDTYRIHQKGGSKNDVDRPYIQLSHDYISGYKITKII